MKNSVLTTVEKFLFGSRWLQLPVYIGLIVAVCAYVYRFFLVLVHLLAHLTEIKDQKVLMIVLELVDFSMIINLLVVVIVGGYSMYVSKVNFQVQEGRPDWLSQITPSEMKVKLIVALVSISGINLLQTFLEIEDVSSETAIFKIVIYLVFVISVLIITWSNRLSSH